MGIYFIDDINYVVFSNLTYYLYVDYSKSSCHFYENIATLSHLKFILTQL